MKDIPFRTEHAIELVELPVDSTAPGHTGTSSRAIGLASKQGARYKL